MAYSELIKNFSKIRGYMRDFYVYGFKSREDFSGKSLRSYDNERRRIESYLCGYMGFNRTAAGKNVFISIDTGIISGNPLYKAFKAKSFTSGDITLHFIIMDILYKPDECFTMKEIMEKINAEYLSAFDKPMAFDESGVRKKLKEYCILGLTESEKRGRNVLYRRCGSFDISGFKDAVSFFSEASQCGVIGSFILNKMGKLNGNFTFKHHYITYALDSGIVFVLFNAIRQRRDVTIKKGESNKNNINVTPLKIYVSSQTGRQYLIGCDKHYKVINSYRTDFINEVEIGKECENYEQLTERLNSIKDNIWGICCNGKNGLEHVEFTIKINDGEEYILNRLEREKRCGEVEFLGENRYRFYADVFDTSEMIPWIRTFIGRITQLDFSNRTVENTFKNDLEEMYDMYGVY